MTRKSNSRSSVISLLGNSALRGTAESANLDFMIVDIQQDRDLEDLLDKSKTDPVLIFKHSTQCSISAQAYEEFVDFVEGIQGLTCGTVLVIENRDLSNAIASRFGVRHQSPQALLIKDGRVIWHASHWSITTDSLRDALVTLAESSHQRN